VTHDAPGDPLALGSRRHDERPPVGLADRARDQAALDQPIEDARERGTFVREAAVQLGDGRRRRRGEQREDVRFAL
jgi:hypothetical protein